MTYQLIETKTLASAATSIEFVSIPQDGTDLVVLLSLRATNDIDYGSIRLNGLTTNFSRVNLFAVTGSSNSSNGDTNNLLVQTLNPSGTTANIFSNVSIYISNYAGNTNKSFTVDGGYENNGTVVVMGIQAFLWNNTAAITSLAVLNGTGNTLTAGSTISLYKITKGSSNGVVVS